MTDEELSELEALEKLATPGPWTAQHSGEYVAGPVINNDFDWVVSWCVLPKSKLDGLSGKRKENARLIVAARNAVPDLIAQVRELKDMLRNFIGPASGYWVTHDCQTMETGEPCVHQLAARLIEQ